MSKDLVDIKKATYEVAGNKIELSPMIIRKYLVTGGGNVTDEEVMMFLKICEGQKLNPFLREAYLVKYGNQPAQIITSKDAFMKRAEANNDYKGNKSGIIVVNLKGDIEERKGTFYLKGREELVGGWAKIFYRSDKEVVEHTVSLDEYIGRKKDGEINSMWSGKPATMIEKVALSQALRKAFPGSLGSMYTSDEMNIDDSNLPGDVIDTEDRIMEEQHIPKTPIKASAAVKSQIMSMAKIKGLVTGDGKAADISGLEGLCNEDGMSLRALTQDQAERLIELINEYEEIQDTEYEEVEE